MVLSSISPLFVFWAIRGNSLIPDRYLIAFCALMIVVPYGFLWWRIRTSINLGELRELVVGAAEDHRDHLLVYLFAMLLPFYAVDLKTWRDVGAFLAALAFVIFLFWHLNLHYMNLVFAALGYRVFTIFTAQEDSTISGKEPLVIITWRVALVPGQRLEAYRLSNTVYFEVSR